MEIFISWSGDRSQKVAEALRDWLPNLIQSVTPFMSASDIEKGSRWSSDIATHLERAQFGLICLTRENLEAPWLLFESGALSKSINKSRVVPYLYRVPLAELQEPLAQFQAALADKSSTLEVVKSINEESGEYTLESTRLEDTFEMWWPHLASILDDIPEAEEEAPPPRTDRDILEEILRLSRRSSRRDVPEFSLDHELRRNILSHGLHRESVDSTEDLDAENLPTYDDPAFRRRLMARGRRVQETHDRRLREVEMREQQLREQEVRLQHLLEVQTQADPSSESEV